MKHIFILSRSFSIVSVLITEKHDIFCYNKMDSSSKMQIFVKGCVKAHKNPYNPLYTFDLISEMLKVKCDVFVPSASRNRIEKIIKDIIKTHITC